MYLSKLYKDLKESTKVDFNSILTEFESVEIEDNSKIIEVKKIEHTNLENEYNKLVFNGSKGFDRFSNLSDCFETYSDELMSIVFSLFDEINKSPYSCSIYSGEKDWGYTEDKSYSVSDHFNFFSRNAYHKRTTTTIESECELRGIDFEKPIWILAQYEKGATPYVIDGNKYNSENDGAYKVVDIFEKDYVKGNKAKDIKQSLAELTSEIGFLTQNSVETLMSEIDKSKLLIDYFKKNKLKSLSDYHKLKLKELKIEYNIAYDSLIDKIKSNKIKASVTINEWGKSKGRFVLVDTKTHDGYLLNKTPSTIMITGGYSSKDFKIDTDILTDNEKKVLYSFPFESNDLKNISDIFQYIEQKYIKKFKM